MFHIVQAGILSGMGYWLLLGFPVHSLRQKTLWCERPASKPSSEKTDAQVLQSPGCCAMLSPLCFVVEMVGWLQNRSLKDICSTSDGLVIGTL